MIQTTHFLPSTCNCSIYYEWDDTVPAEQRVHTATDRSVLCSIHAPLGDPEKGMQAIFTEQQKIGTARVQLANLLKDTHTFTDPTILEVLTFLGHAGTVYRPGYEPSITLDQNREVQISIPNIANADAEAFISTVNTAIKNKLNVSSAAA